MPRTWSSAITSVTLCLRGTAREVPVMTGPDGKAAAADGHLRAAHADREQVIAVLKAAFVQGRLTKDELEARAGQAFAAKTYAELATLTADIPAIPVGLPAIPVGLPAVPVGLPAVPVGGPGAGSAALRPAMTPARTLGLAARRSGVFLIVAVALTEGAFLANNPFLLVLAAYAFIAVSGFLGYGIIDACQQRRSRAQRPGTPGAWPRPPERSPRPG
jgi:hypothetical protein